MIIAVISPDDTARLSLQRAVESDTDFEAIWSLPDYPNDKGLEPCIDQRDGCIVMIDFQSVESARQVAIFLSGHPHVRLVAVNAPPETRAPAAASKCGIRDIIGKSFGSDELAAAIRPAKQHLLGNRAQSLANGEGAKGEIAAFGPARPEAGATTVAVTTAAAICNDGGTSTLLLVLDLRLGI